MSEKSNVVRIFCVVLMLLFLLLALSACGADSDGTVLIISSDTYVLKAGEAVDIDEFRKTFLGDKTEDTTAFDSVSVTADTLVSDEISDTSEFLPEIDTVYWVKGGEVWHTNRNCSSLSKSKSVLSGTVEGAMNEGKSRVCKLCGK